MKSSTLTPLAIENVLTSAGFNRDQIPQGAKEGGLIASYSKYNGIGPRPIGGQSVYFSDDQLRIVIAEGGNLNASVSAATNQLCDSLRKELSSRYGADRSQN